MNDRQILAEILTKNYGKIFASYLLSVVLVASVISVRNNILVGLSFVIFIIFIWEIAVRLVLRLAYGGQYRYVLFNYFLIDHPFYGNAFRAGTDAKKLDFLIFDKTAFPIGHVPETNLSSNQNSRNIFTINSHGYRGVEFSLEKKINKLRIFCTGGSTTAGYCVNDQEAWPAQLEIYLKEQGYDVEIINAGTDGWYSYQELLRFEKEIINYQADILLIHQGWNEEFEYSSLSLGKKWRPKMIRNVRETNNLYCSPNKLFSSTLFLSFYLGFQAALKAWVFIPNMRFTNPWRWQTLLSGRYIFAWFENLMSFARVATTKNIMVYTVNYPALTTLADTEEDRQFYINNSRLSAEYAHYQAISKKRIKRTLNILKSIIPCLDVEAEFDDYKGKARLDLFIDELHMSAKGYRLLARVIGQELINDAAFQERYANRKIISNVNIESDNILAAQNELNQNSSYLERLVKEQIERLFEGRVGNRRDMGIVPEDRYTTY